MKERVGLCPETYEGVPVGYRRRVSRRVCPKLGHARGSGVRSHSLLSRGRVVRVRLPARPSRLCATVGALGRASSEVWRAAVCVRCWSLDQEFPRANRGPELLTTEPRPALTKLPLP